MGLATVAVSGMPPLSLMQAKTFLRIDTGTGSEDDLLSTLITAARERAELHLQRCITGGTFTLTTGEIDPMGRVYLSKAPLLSVQSVNYYDTAGVLQLAAASTYRVVTAEEPGFVVFTTTPAYDSSREDGIKITFTAGYTTVPSGIKLAMNWIVRDAYENRGGSDDEGIRRLLDIYRVWRGGSQ